MYNFNTLVKICNLYYTMVCTALPLMLGSLCCLGLLFFFNGYKGICVHNFFSYTVFLPLHSLMQDLGVRNINIIRSLIHTAKLLRVKPVYVLRQLMRACGVFPEMATKLVWREQRWEKWVKAP